MAQKSPQRHPNELIELTTAFYSLVDATAARRAEVEERNGVSHPGRARPPAPAYPDGEGREDGDCLVAGSTHR